MWTTENRPRYNRDRLRYPSDLTDEEWALIGPGVFGETDRPGRSNALESRRDIDRVAHQVAVALLDHVADMDANAETAFRYGRFTS